MNTRRQFWLGGALLSGGQGITLVLGFVKNMILARLLGLSDMGVASLLALMVYLLGMISNLSLDTMLIQSEEGDDPLMQQTGHSVLLVRAVGSAAVLALLAWPASIMFGVPEARWAFAMLALVPLINGLNHLDLMCQQRKMRFGSYVAVDVGTQLVLLAIAWPLARWLCSYAAMLWLLVGEAALRAVGSHLVARRRFALGWNKQYAGQMFSFGWPLLINGVLMFTIFQGDRFVIGAAQRLFPRARYSLDDLGLYSVAFTLAIAPVAAIGKVGVSLLLPILSRVQKDPEAFRRRYQICVQLACLTAVLFAAVLLLQGDQLLIGLYGVKYSPATRFFALFVVMQSIRVIRMAPTLAALALGDTRNGMLANVARTSSFVLVCIAAAMNLDLAWIAAAGIVGELLAIVCSLVLLAYRLRVQFASAAAPIVVACATISSCAAVGFAKVLPRGLWEGLFASGIITAGAGSALLAASPRLYEELRSVIARKRFARTIESTASLT